MNFNSISSKHLSKKTFEDGPESWRGRLLKVLKFSALLLVPAFTVLIFDRVRYGLLHKDNQNFINEVKSGLGEKVKKNPTRIKKIEKTFSQKTKLFIKNIFTRF